MGRLSASIGDCAYPPAIGIAAPGDRDSFALPGSDHVPSATCDARACVGPVLERSVWVQSCAYVMNRLCLSNVCLLNVMVSAAAAPQPHKDLLGDDDEPQASSPPLQDQSAEIGNVKNQLNSTNRSLEAAKTERASLERQLTEQAAMLASLQTQLSSAKAAYDTETRLLGTLKERFAAQSAEIQKTREELIHAESDLSAMRVEKAEDRKSVV